MSEVAPVIRSAATRSNSLRASLTELLPELERRIRDAVTPEERQEAEEWHIFASSVLTALNSLQPDMEAVADMIEQMAAKHSS